MELHIDGAETEAAGIVFESAGQRQFEIYRQPENTHYGIYDSASGLHVLDHEPATRTTSLQYVRGGAGYTLRLRAADDAARIGFFGAEPTTRPIVSGSWSDGSAAHSMVAALVSLGLIVDDTRD